MSSLEADLTAVGLAAGLDAVGIASAAPFDEARRSIERRKAAGLHAGMAFTYGRPERSADPARHLEGARCLVVGARRYHRDTPRRPPGAQGRVARYAWRDGYAELEQALGAVARRLGDAGWRTLVLADDNRLIDRAAAHRAGLGWFGKNTNLLLAGRGSWFVLGAVLTDAPLRPAAESVADGCGSCTSCQPACPTGALDRAGVLDARRCLAWLLQADGSFQREHRVALGDRLYGCDDCQDACPPNRVEIRRRPAPARSDDEAWVDVVALLDRSDDELIDRYGRWFIPRRRAEYLRRNALVVLGNVGDPSDPAAARAVEHALADPRPVVRAHAVWAARRLGLGHLLGVVADDPAPEVRAELEAPVAVRHRAAP